MTCRRKSLVIIWVCCVLLAHCAIAISAKEHHIKGLHHHIENGGYGLEINGGMVRSYNLQKHFIPASTIKILTGLIALEILGPEYRFATEFLLDDKKNLYIKGEGDPFLVSENITAIAEKLKKMQIKKINTIFLDESTFSLEGPPSDSENSDNPYDAHNGALAVNFNALPFRVHGNGTVTSGEKQTPLLPLMKEIGEKYTKGNHRVSINGFPAQKDYSNTLRYSGELFTQIFLDENIMVENGFTVGKVPQESKRLLLYQSDRTVADLVRSSLFYSSNFIANQLFLSSGRRVFGSPATWKKSQKLAKKFIEVRLLLPDNVIHMVDGSGLSRKNRITPAAMITVLNRFKPFTHLLKKKGDVLVKSGTLTGAYCYAGFFRKDKVLSPFALFLNQKQNKRKKLLKLLKLEHDRLTSK